MANANKAPFSLCLLALVVLSATMAHVATAAPQPHRRRLQKLPWSGGGDDDEPKRAPATAAVACWKSILSSESCVDDILQSLAELRPRVGKACCSVLERVGDRCVVDAFSGFPFNPAYLPRVKRVCGLGV